MLAQNQAINVIFRIFLLCLCIFCLIFPLALKVYAYGSGAYGGCTYGVDCPSSTSTYYYSTSSNLGEAQDEEIVITMTSTSADTEYEERYYTVRVVDSEGNPLSGARIVIESIGIDVITDEHGTADLGVLEFKDYDVEVTYNGNTYSSILSVTDSNDNQVLITLSGENNSPNYLVYALIAGVVILIAGYFILARKSRIRPEERLPR